MATEELLQEFLGDYDNYKNVEELLVDFSSPKKAIWRDLICDAAFWKRLIECLFEDEAHTLFFVSLNEEDHERYFRFGVECMVNFVQANFTGPELPKVMKDFLDQNMFADIDFKKYLSVNNEEININTKYPVLLYTARRIFVHCSFNPVLNLWWQCRAIMIHQHILEELSQVLLTQTDLLCKEIKDLQLEGRIRAKFEIELAQLFILFRSSAKAEAHLETARNLLGVKYELQGKLGKRTKFQEEDIAQLVLQVALLKDESIARPVVQDFDVPKTLTLDDEVRLDTIKYKDANEEIIIPDTEQKLLITAVQEMLISKPQDNLYYEEIKPFLDLVLSQNNTWAVRATVLLIRCKLESQHKRTIERSLMQCEEIVNSIKKETPHPLNRLGGVYATNFQPIWKTESQLAEIMLSLGLVKASLDIYLRLQLWEEVIVCYTILKLRHKATEIIRQQLEANPTVKLWCLLGDATDDVSCYEKAWELSKRRSSRAQRHWGQLLYARKQYQQCIPHFEKSVSINPLQTVVWLNYGYAALETENWQTAATAYRRYTTLEPGNFEAWNNLAKAYIKLGNQRGAHQALIDAVRCNYDNWKVWDNLMAVSADIANFSDVIRAYHRLLDLKEKHFDLEVLGALVYGICNNVTDSEGRPANRLVTKARELLGRVTSLYPTEGHTWELYASLAPTALLRAQRLQRALRGFMQSGWDKNPVNCQQVLYVCHKLAEVALSDDIEATDSLINSVRLSLGSAVAAIRKQDFEDIRSLLQKVQTLFSQVVEKNKTVTPKVETKE